MAFNSGSFGSGPSGYINYKVYQESQKGGGGKPPQNSGCLTSIISVLGALILLFVLLAH